MATATPTTVQFMETMANAMDPQLNMYLVQEDATFALFAGLWSSWFLNETQRRAKVLLVTVLKEPGQPAPPGPLPFASLVPWLVLQTQVLDEASPAWDNVRTALATELAAAGPSDPARTADTLVFDPSQKTHQGRPMARSDALTQWTLTQTAVGGRTVADGVPRPQGLLNRRRVEYALEGLEEVRVYVEKPTTKQPIGKEMEADAGLARTRAPAPPAGPVTVPPAARSSGPSTSGTRGSWRTTLSRWRTVPRPSDPAG